MNRRAFNGWQKCTISSSKSICLINLMNMICDKFHELFRKCNIISIESTINQILKMHGTWKEFVKYLLMVIIYQWNSIFRSFCVCKSIMEHFNHLKEKNLLLAIIRRKDKDAWFYFIFHKQRYSAINVKSVGFSKKIRLSMLNLR